MRRWDKEIMKKLQVVDENRSFVDEDYIFALEQELAISNGYPTYQDMCYDSAQKMINSLKERGLTPMDIGVPMF